MEFGDKKMLIEGLLQTMDVLCAARVLTVQRQEEPVTASTVSRVLDITILCSTWVSQLIRSRPQMGTQ